MKSKSIQEKAWSALSNEVKLHLNLDRSKCDNERFIHCFNYALKISNKIYIGCDLEPLEITNQNVIMARVEYYLNTGLVHPDMTVNGIPLLLRALFCPELVKLLLENGANPNIYGLSKRNNMGPVTALHEAALSWGSFYDQNLLISIELLAAKGANIYATNYYNESPFECIGKCILHSEEMLYEFSVSFENATTNPRPFNEIATPITARDLHGKIQYRPSDEKDFSLFKMTHDEKYLFFKQPEFILKKGNRLLKIKETDAAYFDCPNDDDMRSTRFQQTRK